MNQEALDAETIQKFARATEQTLLLQERLGVSSNSNANASGNTTKIIFEGGKSVIASALVGLIGGVCIGVSVAVVGWVSWSLNRQDSMNNWTAQEVTAIRSYITNGKLQPMTPRPFTPEDKKD